MPTTTPVADPFPVTAILIAATEAALISGLYATQSELAAAAGLTQPALSRALRVEARPSTVRAVLRACGMRLELVPVAEEAPR